LRRLTARLLSRRLLSRLLPAALAVIEVALTHDSATTTLSSSLTTTAALATPAALATTSTLSSSSTLPSSSALATSCLFCGGHCGIDKTRNSCHRLRRQRLGSLESVGSCLIREALAVLHDRGKLLLTCKGGAEIRLPGGLLSHRLQ
jgi:hypothetical protein